MKKIISVLVILSMITIFSGCGDTKVIDKIEYDTYGLFNKETKRNPNIEYKTIIGNIVWSVILVETIIAPIYFLGFSLYEPIRKVNPNRPKDSI
ncbi:hypothetical protein LCGC14_1637440 [marine sediment metagenome]|uniref:Lipoprotein n=1 Tax=marine sediment metagenome TaxID=412755 RepID=A0A0F9I149_9ZZZZ